MIIFQRSCHIWWATKRVGDKYNDCPISDLWHSRLVIYHSSIELCFGHNQQVLLWTQLNCHNSSNFSFFVSKQIKRNVVFFESRNLLLMIELSVQQLLKTWYPISTLVYIFPKILKIINSPRLRANEYEVSCCCFLHNPSQFQIVLFRELHISNFIY